MIKIDVIKVDSGEDFCVKCIKEEDFDSIFSEYIKEMEALITDNEYKFKADLIVNFYKGQKGISDMEFILRMTRRMPDVREVINNSEGIHILMKAKMVMVSLTIKRSDVRILNELLDDSPIDFSDFEEKIK